MSTSSKARFAARARARRRRRIGAVAAVVALVLGAGWAALLSPWAVVREVTVSGTRRIPASTVRTLLADQEGQPLLLVDTVALQARVKALSLVAGVSVRRAWPSELSVTVRERQAVAAVPAGSGVRLVDVEGVQVDTAPRAPAGLPVVRVDLARAAPGTLPAVLAVLSGMPATLVTQVTAIGAGSPDSVWLTLTDGSRVVWGSAADTSRKAAVLARLRVAARREGGRARGRQYDISAPDAPAVSTPPARR